MEVVTEENTGSVEEQLLSDRRLTLKEISVRLEIPKTTVIKYWNKLLQEMKP
jgi:predicted transcriptional regulator